ncbi:MAG: hypothetical protein ABI665_24225 [Vicinamibacterales bacterium]
MIGPRARVAIGLAFLVYVVFFRTYDITGTFLLLGEQMRDWTLALGSWRDLPLTGTPSTSGGRGFGPIYYWILWSGRHLIGPFTSNLPHAGGLTVALLQAVADAWLFIVLARRISLPLALAVGLIMATGPFDVGLSKAIWNPPVATALVKMTIAQMLTLGNTPALWRIAAVSATAWFAVQAHSSGFFVAAPVFAALVVQPLARAKALALQDTMESDGFSRRWRRALEHARVVVEVIVVLEIPYVIAQFRTPASTIGPTVVFDSLANAAKLEVATSFSTVVNITGELVMHRHDTWSFALVTVIAAAIAAWRWRRDVPMLSVSVGPLFAATALFSTWTRPYDSYWFLALAPSMVLTLALVVTAIPRALVSRAVSVALILLALYWQPARFRESQETFPYPPYRPLLEGSRAALRRAPVLRHLRVAFPIHETTDTEYMYRILGGRIEPTAEFDGKIQPDGTVVFTPAPPISPDPKIP